MVRTIATAASLAVLTASSAFADNIKITPNASLPTQQAPGANFSGSVLVDLLTLDVEAPPAASGIVAFQPGARTAWPSHPAGQMLVVLSGKGWIQEEGTDAVR